MCKFINDDFLLSCEKARVLYHAHARPQPIIDYHCHLPPSEVAENKKWENVAQIFLGGDHYKWRAMRSNGIDEKFITGDASDREKWEAFAQTMPKLLRNPIYHWTHLELARYFEIDDVLLSPATSEEIWNRANKTLQNGLTARECMKKYAVKVVCTTDDPVSDLADHIKYAKEGCEEKMLPTFRADKAHAIENPKAFVAYIETLAKAAGTKIESYSDLINALKARHDYFDKSGCRVSDNGISSVWHEETSASDLNAIFRKATSGGKPTHSELAKFKSAILTECAVMDYDAGWARQLHIGPLRNNNTKMFDSIGPDTGFDSIGESNFANGLSRHLDALNVRGKLGRTIIYNIHPKDNEMIATMIGNFQDSSCPGKMQFGSGWWFMDQLDGMTRQIEAISTLGLISRFLGMLTDSRSFLSYCRHEYFRRLLCNILGKEMEAGLLPADIDLVGGMVEDIAYNNAKNYFNL